MERCICSAPNYGLACSHRHDDGSCFRCVDDEAGKVMEVQFPLETVALTVKTGNYKTDNDVYYFTDGSWWWKALCKPIINTAQ